MLKTKDAEQKYCPIMSATDNVLCCTQNCMAWKFKIVTKTSDNFCYPIDETNIVEKLDYIENKLTWREYDKDFGYCTIYGEKK